LDKLFSLFGIARAARLVELGYDKSLESIHRNKAYVVFVASDISIKTKRGLIFAAEKNKIPVTTLPQNITDFSAALDIKTGIISINNAGFSKKMLEIYKSNLDFRGCQQ